MPEARSVASGALRPSPSPGAPVAASVTDAGLLRLAGIAEDSIVDGPGLRLTLFTQGCPHHCPGCHNPETHAMEGGALYPLEAIVARYAENPLLAGVTFSGGEPFLQAGALARLAARIHAHGGTVVTYTGYVYETLAARAARDADVARLLDATDLLIDGPYVQALRSLDLPFRGSSNQRLLDRDARAALGGGVPSA